MSVTQRDAPVVVHDAEIIERSWLDPEQFAKLFDRHAPLIHSYAARRIAYLGSTDIGPGAKDSDASALVQMAFVNKAGQLP